MFVSKNLQLAVHKIVKCPFANSSYDKCPHNLEKIKSVLLTNSQWVHKFIKPNQNIHFWFGFYKEKSFYEASLLQYSFGNTAQIKCQMRKKKTQLCCMITKTKQNYLNNKNSNLSLVSLMKIVLSIMAKSRQLLLISSSQVHGHAYLQHSRHDITKFFEKFVPFSLFFTKPCVN